MKNAFTKKNSPAKHILNFNSSENFAEINIHSLDGKNIFSKSILGYDQLDVSGFSKGVYLIDIQTNNERFFYKLFIK